eukprot:jgi/Chlat1/265/Chrsp1S03159
MEPLWRPDVSYAGTTAMAAFMREAGVQDYQALHDWSVRDFRRFWQLLLRFTGVVYDGDDGTVLADDDQTPSMPPKQPGFFPNIRLNFAENLLRRRDSAPALASFSEVREPVRLTYAQLHSEVAMGVKAGDRVAGFIPNIAEAVVAMLAATSLGAIWSSCSPDFGVRGAVDRFGQITPVVLIAANAYGYHGKKFGCLDKCAAIMEQVPSIRHIVVVALASDALVAHSALQAKALSWDRLPGTPAEEIPYVRLPFNHPLYIMYSSGTTGVPKCIVHGVGGTLLQHVKELMLHSDLRKDDNIIYFTTCGWMMWNWLVSALFVGCVVTLFDGSPSYPNMEALWRLADTEGITHFGTSAKFIASCKGKVCPKSQWQLSRLRVVLSTGSPLAHEDFEWVYTDVKYVQLSSISGGTDIISCFMLGNPVLPVYRGEIQCLGLGMDVVALDENDQAVLKAKGELACKTPFPSMPVYFWDDAGDDKYRNAYFKRMPGVWLHGDYISITGTQGRCGGVIVYGRSDATLNPGGVRIGTAEIYRLVEMMPEVEDSVVIGQPVDGDVRVVLFVKLASGQQFSHEFEARLRTTVRAGSTPRHVPAVVVPVEKIPYTRSGKKMELAVLEVVTGHEPKNIEAMVDPTALDCYRELPSLSLSKL